MRREQMAGQRQYARIGSTEESGGSVPPDWGRLPVGCWKELDCSLPFQKLTQTCFGAGEYWHPVSEKDPVKIQSNKAPQRSPHLPVIAAVFRRQKSKSVRLEV